jgi:hypothetical protein
MEQDTISRPFIAGYLIVLVGVAGWVLSCFLALYRITGLDDVKITLFRQVFYGSVMSEVGGLLYLFGAVAVIGVIALLGLLRPRRWISALLAGAVIGWMLISVGALITIGGNIGQVSTFGASLAVGYWTCWVSVVCVVAGTVAVLTSAPREDVKTGAMAPQEPIS